MTSKLDYDSIPAGKTEWDEDVNERFQEIKDKFNSLLEIAPIWPVLDFDGEDDYVEGPNLGLGSQTIEGWINSRQDSADTGGDLTVILGNYGNDSDKKYLLIGIDGSDLTWRVDDGDDSYKKVGESSFSTDTWYHVAIVYNSDGTVTAYLDGEEVDSIDYTSDITFDSIPFRLGNSSDNNEYFDGEISEVRIWDVARTQQEIQDNMNSRLNGDESGLVAYYPLDDGGGNTVKDATGNGNDGTINGASWKPLTLDQHPVEGD